MTYEEFRGRSHFDKEELLAHGHGTLVKGAPENFLARLPVPPMLMIDRILEVSADGPRGQIVAERDVHIDDWFFQCHFIGDPVQPGCLGVDGIWQLLGFYCAWRGGLGSGRALGCGEIEFFGQIRPHDKLIRYEIAIRRYADLPASGSAVVVGDASLSIDGEPIYTIKRAKVGLFSGIAYSDYPHPSERSRGGRMDR